MIEPYWASEDGDVVLHLGKCEKVLPNLPANSVDAIVTAPPAAVRFMGREWDSDRGGRDKWVAWLAECMEAAARVLKPGGHLLVWSLPRTSHWTAWALEDAGLEIRDCILHLFGSGFPKSLDVGRAIDKASGVEREVIGHRQYADGSGHVEVWPGGPNGHEGWQRPGAPVGPDRASRMITAPATENAVRWEGWGTALKPGQEMWWLARKPLAAGTVAANVLEFGTGALNIDGCKVSHASEADRAGYEAKCASVVGLGSNRNGAAYGTWSGVRENSSDGTGRWPTNITFTHSAACDSECAPDCPVGELDRQSGVSGETARVLNRNGARQMDGWGLAAQSQGLVHGDSGGASRFYPTFRYQAKAPTSERPRLEDGTAHETVKSLGLTAWMVKLVTPPGGTVLDMFAGSGPVGEVCVIEGFRCVLIEQDRKSAELIKTRLAKPIQPVMFRPEDSAPAAPARPVAASRPKPAPVVHPSLFDLEAS